LVAAHRGLVVALAEAQAEKKVDDGEAAEARISTSNQACVAMVAP
jgi:hypothetical protein